MSQEDDGLYVLYDGDSLPTSNWINEDTPQQQFAEYIKLDPQWATIELMDTETRMGQDVQAVQPIITLTLVFVCILPPQTEILKGEWKLLKREEFNSVTSPTVYKAMQRIQ